MGFTNSGDPSWSRWTVLSACILVQSVGGLQYMFGTFSETLKSTFELEQTQIDSIGTAATLGANTGFYLGYFIDYYGPKIVLLYAALLGFTGFFFTGASLFYKWDMHNHGHAQQTSDIAIIPTVQKLFPYNKGSITGIVKAFVGLSGSLATTIYILVTDSTLLLIILGIYYALACLIGASIIHASQSHRRSLALCKLRTKWKLNTFSFGIFILLTLLLFSDIIDEIFDLDFNIRILIFLVVFGYLALFVNQIRLQTDERVVIDSTEETSEPLLVEQLENSSIQEEGNKDYSCGIAILQPVFWIIWLTVFFTCGTGLMLIVNLGQLVYVVGLSSREKTIFVSILSICNCSGRITGGLLSDYISEKFGLPRLYVMLAALLFMTSSMFLALTSTPFGLFISTMFAGFAYGLLYGSMPVVLGENFGLRNLGSIYASMALGVCFGSFVFAKFLFSAVYESHAYIVKCPGPSCRKGLKDGDEVCEGSKCIVGSFIIAAICCLVCSVTVIIYLWKLRYEKKINDESSQEVSSNS